MTQRKSSAGFHSDSPALSDAFKGYLPIPAELLILFPGPTPSLGSPSGFFLLTGSSPLLCRRGSGRVCRGLGLSWFHKKSAVGTAGCSPCHSRRSGDVLAQQTDRRGDSPALKAICLFGAGEVQEGGKIHIL